MLELIIRPATPAHSPQNTYARTIRPEERMPTSREASALPPTDSMSRPSAVRRVSTTVTARATATRMIENGRPSQ